MLEFDQLSKGDLLYVSMNKTSDMLFVSRAFTYIAELSIRKINIFTHSAKPVSFLFSAYLLLIIRLLKFFLNYNIWFGHRSIVLLLVKWSTVVLDFELRIWGSKTHSFGFFRTLNVICIAVIIFYKYISSLHRYIII